MSHTCFKQSLPRRIAEGRLFHQSLFIERLSELEDNVAQSPHVKSELSLSSALNKGKMINELIIKDEVTLGCHSGSPCSAK